MGHLSSTNLKLIKFISPQKSKVSKVKNSKVKNSVKAVKKTPRKSASHQQSMDPKTGALLPNDVFFFHIAPRLPIDTRLALRVPPRPLVRDMHTDNVISLALKSRAVNAFPEILHQKLHEYRIPLPYKTPSTHTRCYTVSYDYSGKYVVLDGRLPPYVHDDATRISVFIGLWPYVWPGTVVEHVFIPADPCRPPRCCLLTST